MRRAGRGFLGLLAVVLVAGACSGDDGAELATEDRSAEIEVVESGASSYDLPPIGLQGSAGVVLRNSGSTRVAFVRLELTLQAADGTSLGTANTYVTAIDPDSTAHAALREVPVDAAVASVEARVTGAVTADEATVVPLGGVSVADLAEGRAVTGTARNAASDKLESGIVTCVLRSGGRIVGGGDADLETIEPGDEVSWRVPLRSELGPVDEAVCSAGAVRFED